MTTRIVLALVAFTAAVLVGAVVPLTLNATGHDRTNFVEATVATARTDAALAQARLDFLAQQQYSGKLPSPAAGQAALAQWNPVLAALEGTRQSGDGLLILSNTLQTVAELGMPPGNYTELAEEAVEQAQPEIKANQVVQAKTETTGTQVIAAMPVFSQGEQSGPVVGTVIVARSTKSLESNIVALWVILGTISVGAVIAAALLAFGLARWVSRPLKGLDAAARRLADGDLAIRTVVGSGPPELRRLGTTFNTMAGRLEALVHGNRAVIADVSHQLRTPLAALRLRLDLLAADAAQLDPATSHELAGALDELARLSRLVDGLLAVARA